nr:nicotinamide mononucleotide transporter [Weissella cibaria]
MLAQILATYGYLSQWVVWLFADAVGLLLCRNQIQAGRSSALGMFILMIVKPFNAFYGMHLWSKTTEY